MSSGTSFHPVVVAPTYQNAQTLEDVLNRISLIGLPVIVVDDGCTDESPRILGRWVAQQGGRFVVTHPRNRGKAGALLSGFEKARAQGFTHAITIDTDGQLDPAQIPELLERAADHPHSIVIGCRDAGAGDYPSASRLGRWASNLLIRWESGIALDDSQCGFRVYPLRLIAPLPCRAGRFGFETEILTRATWAGVKIEQIGVGCRYVLPGGRVSHFRPWRDSLSAAAMHVKLMALAVGGRRRASHAAAPLTPLGGGQISGERGLI